jgi:toxin-antitoxin system PIN domain toxin
VRRQVVAIDTNILFYAANADCPEHDAARGFLESRRRSADTVISELVLVELYCLLRNPTLCARPMDAPSAAASVGAYRRHPRWRLVDHHPDSMDRVWAAAGAVGFPRGRIFDVRLAESLRLHGVTELATRNVRDFEGLGFERVFNPVG